MILDYNVMKKACIVVLVVLLHFIMSCGKEPSKSSSFGKALPKSTPQDLNYENVSILLNDMKIYSEAVRALDQKMLQTANDRYVDVYFQLEQDPLVFTTSADAAHGQAIFILAPKDTQTGSNILLKFDKKLPVVDSDTLELDIKTKNENETFTCALAVADPEAYLNEFRTHDLSVRMTLYKKFLQSGTFDFDALTVTSYRLHGYPFVVFDLVKAELTDKTANLNTPCRLS